MEAMVGASLCSEGLGNGRSGNGLKSLTTAILSKREMLAQFETEKYLDPRLSPWSSTDLLLCI
jgi:hypothetical protein